jgi:hypothetical protein
MSLSPWSPLMPLSLPLPFRLPALPPHLLLQARHPPPRLLAPPRPLLPLALSVPTTDSARTASPRTPTGLARCPPLPIRRMSDWT